MDNPFKSPAIISFCPGILGLERGLIRSIGNIRTIAYVEIEAFIIANLVAQMESGLLATTPIWTDVKTFPGHRFRDKIHGFIGGYPCTPFSLIGRRTGEEHDQHLWPYIFNHFKSIRPFWGWFENVTNHLNIGYQNVKSDLEGIGYTVTEGIFSAEEIGSPTLRERLFILAVDNTIIKGLEGYARDVYAPTGQKEFIRGGGERKDRSITETNIFPRERGLPQWEWEEPRVNYRDESSLVYKIDGYDFTTDLHRAIGNSVVEQTAEIAFKTLIYKLINASNRK